jgi:hypothetical protein
MNEIVNELARPVWWFSVVIAGIVINLLSSYLRARLDSALSRASGWWRSRSERRKAAWESKISLISQDTDFKAMHAQREIRLRLNSIYALLAGFLLLSLPSLLSSVGFELTRLGRIPVLGVCAFMLFVSFVTQTGAESAGDALREAAKRRVPKP